MKMLFCGLGSIGRRHLGNAAEILDARGTAYTIDALRATARALPGEVTDRIAACYTDDAALPDDYDIAFITNPTALHADTVRLLAGKAKNLFIEKPVFDRADVKLDALGLPSGVSYVACPLRQHPVLRRMRALVGQKRVIAARAICSSYLPDWRPGTDYRVCYSANRAQGGGVALDLIHEWDYLVDLFGLPAEVTGFTGTYSDLELDSDDVAVYIARYATLLLTLQLDYIGRAPKRSVEIFCEDDTVTGDLLAGTVTFGRTGEVERYPDTDVHRAEMQYFLDCVAGKAENINPPARALKVLASALSAKGVTP